MHRLPHCSPRSPPWSPEGLRGNGRDFSRKSSRTCRVLLSRLRGSGLRLRSAPLQRRPASTRPHFAGPRCHPDFKLSRALGGSSWGRVSSRACLPRPLLSLGLFHSICLRLARLPGGLSLLLIQGTRSWSRNSRVLPGMFVVNVVSLSLLVFPVVFL